MTSYSFSWRRATLACLVFSLLSACGSSEDEGERLLTPYPAELSMSSLYPLDNNDEDPATSERVPFERVVLLRATGGLPVEISKICLVGDAKNQFVLEGPKPATATAATDAAVRVTYERANVGGPDQIALVVESNSTTPTLVVPICARVIKDGTRGPVACESPVTVEEASCP